MFKLFAVVFAAILAVAAAGVVSYSGAPVAYSAGVAPVAYSAGVAPVAYSSPYVRSAVVPAAYSAYSAGYVSPVVHHY